MWATVTWPFTIASSTMAVRISGVIFRPGSGVSLTHILDEVDPLAGEGADHLARLLRRGGLLGVDDGQTRGFAGRRRAARAGGQGDGDTEHALQDLTHACCRAS